MGGSIGNKYAWRGKTVVYEQENPYEEGGSWTEAEDPCPADFRVPTIEEWKAVLNKENNAIEMVFKEEEGEKSLKKFIAWKIGNRLTLSFEHDLFKYIWSSSELGYWNYGYTVRMYNYENIQTSLLAKEQRASVRCIKKLPNEYK